MTAVLFVSALLPALSDVDGVEIEQVGTVPDYREVVDRARRAAWEVPRRTTGTGSTCR